MNTVLKDKRIIISGFITCIFTCLFLMSCTVSQSTDNSQEQSQVSDSPLSKVEPIEKAKKYNVNVSIMKHIPYCGGAAPDPSQLNNYANYTSPLIVIDEMSQKKTEMWMEGGNHYAYLTPGKYVIKEKFKDVPLDEFIKNNSREGTYYTNGTEECFENWRNSNLFEFEVTNQDTVVNLSTTIGASCFTGSNPCLQYSGPYPP